MIYDTSLSLSLTHRFKVEGAHTDKTYTYSIGICVDADSQTSGCAVKQTDSTANSSNTRCIGKTTQAQVARSEYIYTNEIIVCSACGSDIDVICHEYHYLSQLPMESGSN